MDLACPQLRILIPATNNRAPIVTANQLLPLPWPEAIEVLVVVELEPVVCVRVDVGLWLLNHDCSCKSVLSHIMGMPGA